MTRPFPTTRLVVGAVALVAAVALLGAPGSSAAAPAAPAAPAATAAPSAPAKAEAPAASARQRPVSRQCRPRQQRLDRLRREVRSLRSQLRAARAAGQQQRADRLLARLRSAEARRDDQRYRTKLACDRTAPQTRITSGPGDGRVVQVRTPLFGVATGARDLLLFECKRDGAPWRRCADRKQRTAMGSTGGYGAHVLRVRAVDTAGNADPTPAVRRYRTHYYAALDAGGDRTCGLRPTGTISCWGEPFPAGARPPAGTYRSLDVGPGDHACAVRRSDNGIVCWGADGAGQATVPPGASGGAAGRVFVGVDHTCTPTRCWGDGADGQLDVPAGVTVGGAGDDFTCGYRASGNARPPECWGDATDGRTTPPSSAQYFLAVGEVGACGVYSDAFASSLECWGSYTDFRRNADWIDTLTLGLAHGCAYSANYAYLECFGADDRGQTSVPPLPQALRRLDAYATYRDPTAGRRHTCALRIDGATVCWGDDRAGQSTPVPA